MFPPCAPWRCGVLTTQRRESWGWVGPPAWRRACFNSPELGGGSLPVKTEPHQIVLLLWLFLTQIDEPAMPMSTQLNDLSGNPGAESPGSKTLDDSGTTDTCD